MRAITGAVVSSLPCSLAKAAQILSLFSDSAASHLPSSDCATYLRTAADATSKHDRFRRELRASHQRGAANLGARDYEGLVEGERKHQDREREEDVAVPAGGSHHDSAAQAELEVAAGEKKSKKSKNEKEDPPENRSLAGVASLAPASPEIASEKKRRKKEKHSKDGQEAIGLKQEAALVAEGEIGSAKKKSKKKKEKVHVKREENASDADEVDRKIVSDGVAEQSGAGGEEKKRKKKKHQEAEGKAKDVKEKEKRVADGDLDSEKKRKRKRGRDDNDDNTLEQVEHTKKKHRKQS